MKLTDLATAGGCAAKYSASRLEELLRGFVPAEAENLLVGLDPADDAVATVRVATALRRAGIAVCIGPSAERAGREVRAARVVDEAHVAYEGETRSLDALVTLLGGSLGESTA